VHGESRRCHDECGEEDEASLVHGVSFSTGISCCLTRRTYSDFWINLLSATSHLFRQCHRAEFVPSYGGGPVTVSHRLPMRFVAGYYREISLQLSRGKCPEVGRTQSVIIKDTEKLKRVSDEKSASVKCVDTVI
jgi:hypothetical protein